MLTLDNKLKPSGKLAANGILRSIYATPKERPTRIPSITIRSKTALPSFSSSESEGRLMASARRLTQTRITSLRIDIEGNLQWFRPTLYTSDYGDLHN